MVFCSDLLDALTQEFFSRDGNAIEEPLHVEDIKVSKKILEISLTKFPQNHFLKRTK